MRQWKAKYQYIPPIKDFFLSPIFTVTIESKHSRPCVCIYIYAPTTSPPFIVLLVSDEIDISTSLQNWNQLLLLTYSNSTSEANKEKGTDNITTFYSPPSFWRNWYLYFFAKFEPATTFNLSFVWLYMLFCSKSSFVFVSEWPKIWFFFPVSWVFFLQ